MGGFSEGGFSNSRFVVKPGVATASEVSILSKNSLANTDFHAQKTQHVQLFENPFLENPPIRDSQFSGPNPRGGTNRVFGKPCFCPLPKRGRFDENGENDEFHSTH